MPILRRIFNLFRHRSIAQDIDAEMQSHLEMRIEENLAAGMPEAEARRDARLRFGNPAAMRERTLHAEAALSLDSLWRDLRHGLRSLRRSPGFSLLAIGIMALGIGATVALFTVTYAVLMRPLPFKEPGKLLALGANYSGARQKWLVPVAPGDFYDWQKQTHGFQQMAIWEWSGFNLSGREDRLPEFVNAGYASWNLFSTLGISPVLGRSFTASDDRQSATPTVLLAWSLFHRRFNGDPSIVGKAIRLNGRLFTVIGVLPKWFTYPDAKIELWVPFRLEESAEDLVSHGNHCCWAIARLRHGVSAQQAMQQVNAVQYRIYRDFPENGPASSAVFRPLMENLVQGVKTSLFVLLAAVGCLLLIACLNLSNLLIARSTAKRKEIAIRSALGGSRWRLCREQLMESLLICATGGILGFLIAIAATHWLVSSWQDMPRAGAIHIDLGVVLFTVVIVLFAGIFATLAPALSAVRVNLLIHLQEGSRTPSRGALRASMRRVMLVAELALTVVLLVCAGLLFKSFLQLRQAELGCSTHNILTLQYFLRGDKYSKPYQIVDFNSQLLARASHLPGVESVGMTNVVPGDGYWGDDAFTIPEHPPLPPGHEIYALFRTASPDFFTAMGIPLVSGRFFTQNERLNNDAYAIINQAFAQKFFPGENPLGKHIQMKWDSGTENHAIVGIVGNTRYSLSSEMRPMMYFPVLSGKANVGDSVTLVVHARGDAAMLAMPVQKVIAQLDPGLPVEKVLTMRQIVGQGSGDAQLNACLVMAFGILSLVLACAGLYGVLSFVTAQRTTEIGIRMALGAPREEVLYRTLLDGLRPVWAGLILGLAASFAVTRWIASMLYRTQPLDPAIFVLVTVALLAVSIFACAAPAWRASRIDPMQALRSE